MPKPDQRVLDIAGQADLSEGYGKEEIKKGRVRPGREALRCVNRSTMTSKSGWNRNQSVSCRDCVMRFIIF